MWTVSSLVTLALVALEPAVAIPTQSGAPLGAVEWFPGRYFSARNRAQASGQWTLVAFWMDGSPWCKRLIDDTFGDASVAARLDDLMCINVDLTRRPDGTLLDPRAQDYTDRFPVAILPSMFFVSPEGELEDLLTGYVPPAPFLAELTRIESGDKTLSALRAAVEAQPDDIAARLALSQKLEDLGDLARRDEQLAAVKELDPQEVSLPVRRRKMGIVRETMESNFDDDKGLYDTTPLEEFLRDEKHTELLLDGWSYLIELYPRVDRAPDARAASKELWQHVPEADVMARGAVIARTFWQQRDELDSKERKFALQVASQVAGLAQKNIEDPVQLAKYLEPLACCYYMNRKRAAAIETIKRCMELDPAEESYAVRLEVFKLRK